MRAASFVGLVLAILEFVAACIEARVDRHEGLHISDRSKNLIMSGGEWISSISVEDAASSFKGVAMAARAKRPIRSGERVLCSSCNCSGI